jgi:hypothetical protein
MNVSIEALVFLLKNSQNLVPARPFPLFDASFVNFMSARRLRAQLVSSAIMIQITRHYLSTHKYVKFSTYGHRLVGDLCRWLILK